MKNRKEHIKLEHYLYDNYSAESANTYSHAIHKFLLHYPSAKNLQLTAIEKYLASLKLKGRSVGYRTVILAAIKAYYNFLLHNEIIEEHPCRAFFIGEKKATGKDFSSLFTMEEMELLLTLREERYKKVKNRNKAIIGLLIYQGVTSGELVQLKANAIDLDVGTVKIKGNGKNKTRTLQLKSRQVITLMKYIEEDREHLLKTRTNKLFITMRGMPMTVDGLHGFISGMQGAFDKEIAPKYIRASVISYWLNERKFPLEDVQVMAGHRYPSSTEKYIRNNTEEQREVVTELHASIFG